MPKRVSPYAGAYARERRALLRGGRRCVYCGQPATEADHTPPVSLHHHRNGSGCCRLVPACGSCQRRQGALIQNRRWSAVAVVESDVMIEPVGFDVEHPVWDVPWLAGLRGVPVDAVWPRLMTRPHPLAVGSLGDEFAEWVQQRTGRPLRWWQLLVAVRLLEHDDAGALVWESLLLTVSRQSGKSWLLRELFLWRIHQSDRFGEEQLVVHTGKDLAICKEVQRPARLWARARPDEYRVREANGQEEIELLADGCRWLVRAKDSVYGLSATMVGVDEAWAVSAAAVEEGLEPTMTEHEQAQTVLVSTAHRMSTSLMLTRRAAALDDLGTGAGDLLVEWSAPRIGEIDERSSWRMASPHWSERRERRIVSACKKALSGESVDPDEPDPLESFRGQWLNQWPLRVVRQAKGDELLAPGAWAVCGRPSAPPRRLWVAVEDNYGNGAAVGAVAELVDGMLEVDGWLSDSRDTALVEARALLAASPDGRLIVSAGIPGMPRSCSRAGSSETRSALPLWRSVVGAGRIVHDATVELDEQLASIRVRPVSGGLSIVSGTGRSDLVRAVSWALLAAVVPPPSPSIH